MMGSNRSIELIFGYVKAKYVFLFFSINLFVSCGGSEIQTDGPTIRYQLDRLNTNQKINALVITTDGGDISKYTYSVGGIGFTSPTPFDTILPIQERTRILYDEEAIYTLGVTIYNEDGIPFIDDTLAWEYSLEKPPDPIVLFKERATKDGLATLLLNGNLERKTVDIWVEGDLRDYPNGYWSKIPVNLQFPIQTSETDGVKNFRIKYQNIYGNHSNYIETSIIKKSTPPRNCRAYIPSEQTGTRNLRILLAAENDGEMFYKIEGDVDPNPWLSYINQGVAAVLLSPVRGVKNLVVKMEDVAGNPCDDIPISLQYEPGVIGFGMIFENEAVWTDETAIKIYNSFDRLATDPAEMYIDGPHVVESEVTHAWVPYQDVVDLVLRETDGVRDVFIKFRVSPMAPETKTIMKSIYLRPRMFFRNDKVNFTAGDQVVAVTITGCFEEYISVEMQDYFPCSSSLGSTIQGTLLFTDGTSVTRTIER